MDVADCSVTMYLGENVSQKAISDTTVLSENSVVDKTEFNMQDSELPSKETVLCCSASWYKADCKISVGTPITETNGNVLEEKSAHLVNLNVDIIEKYNETKDTQKTVQEVKSDLVQHTVQEMDSFGSGKERSRYNICQRHSLIKSPDSGMNDFTENSAEIDFGNSSLVSSISARGTVPQRLFHDNRCEERPVTQRGVARPQIEDSGAVACDEISQGRSSGSVGTAECSQYDSVALNEVEVTATSIVPSTEDFPQDLSINTLEEICQVTELLAANTDSPIASSQNHDDTCKNEATPVSTELSSLDKSCLCRTSTPVRYRNQHSKFGFGTRKKRIKFVHVYDNEKPNKHDENVRTVKENIQVKYEVKELQQGGNSALEQSVDALDNSVVDISSRVQNIKKTLNQIKKFTYVPSNVKMKAAITQNNDLNILIEDVVNSAQAMENVVETKPKDNNMGRFNAVLCDRQGFIPFCKLGSLPRFVTKGESSEDSKLTSAAPDPSDSAAEPILISCNHSLSSNTVETCGKALSTGKQGNMIKSIGVGGGTNAESKNICSTQCDSGSGVQEQSGFLIKDSHATRKFKQSSEAEEPCNALDTRCDIQEDFSRQLDDFPSGSKIEMGHELTRPMHTTEIFGFKNNTSDQIRLSSNGFLKSMMLNNVKLVGEKVPVSSDMTFRIPGQDSKCKELKDMKISAAYSPYSHVSCEQSNVTADYKSDVSVKVFRQENILNKNKSSVMCGRHINKHERVMHVETESYQNCNRNETVTEENTLILLEDKREGENTVTDLQFVLAAEDAELMQQLVEDGSIFSQWPSEVHGQETGTLHISSHGGKGSVLAEEKESCTSNHVTRDPQEDVSMTGGGNKSLFSKSTILCTSDYQNVEVSGRNLQQIGLGHLSHVFDSTKTGENENSMFNKVVEITNISDNGLTNQVKAHSEEVYVEGIVNTTGVRQPFSENFDTLNSKNRPKVLINRPENSMLNIDGCVLTIPRNRTQNVQPEMTECVASHDCKVETVLCKSDNNLSAVTETMDLIPKTDFQIEYPATTKLLRTNRRKTSVLGAALLNTEAEDEQQKSENIQIIDCASDTGNNVKLIKLNTGVGERGLLEKLGETDSSLQVPVTYTRHLFKAKNLTPLKFRQISDCGTNVGKSDQDTAENVCCLLENENNLQQLLRQSDRTVNISEQLYVGKVEVPEESVANSSNNNSTGENSGDILQTVQSLPNCDYTMAVDSISTVSGRKVLVSAKALRNAKHVSPEVDANIPSTLQNSWCPTLECPETVDAVLIHDVSSAQCSGHGTEYSELEGAKQEGARKKTSVSAGAPSRAKLLSSNKKSEKGELITGSFDMKEIKQKVSLLKEYKTMCSVQNSEALNVPDLVISDACQTVNEHKMEGELKERERQHLPVFQGIKTASGSEVFVSVEALNRAKLLFSEEEMYTKSPEDEIRASELNDPQKISSRGLHGFSLANKKGISVSANISNSTKLLFSEEGNVIESTEGGTKSAEFDEEAQKTYLPVLKQFSSVSGKKVSVSAVALKRAQLMFSEEESCKEAAEEVKRVPELKEKEEPQSPVLKALSAASGKQAFVTVTGLNRTKVLFSEVAESCTEVGAHKGNDSYVNENQEISSQMSQTLLPVSESCDSESAGFLNTERLFILEEEHDTHKTIYFESEKLLLNSETSPRQQITSVSKETPKRIKHNLSRSVSGQEKSIKILHSEQTSSSRPLLLNVNQSKTENCHQSTCISEEVCHRAETSNGSTNIPNIRRNLHHSYYPIIQVDSCSTGSTGTNIIKEKKRYDLGIGTRQPDDVAEYGGKRDCEAMSLTQEVKESAAALLADEAVFNSPAWIGSYVSCPDTLHDRCPGPPAVVCSDVKEGSALTVVDPGSPVLGSHDHFRKRRRVTMIADDLSHNSHTPANSSFKVNHLHFMSFYTNKYVWLSY
jgi:hypothetical protein